MKSAENPFTLGLASGAKGPLTRTLCRVVEPCIERLLALDKLDQGYRLLKDQASGGDFLDITMESLEFSYRLERGALDRIPAAGPLIVVANHPFGGVEGLILAKLLREIRPDAKIMANYLLGRITELRQKFILVDPFGAAGSAKSNLSPLREGVKWVTGGGALGVFPAGTVSHLQLRRFEVSDPEWSSTVARLVRLTQAPVLPVFFHDVNAWFFQLAGLLHPYMRTALLPREFFNKRGMQLRVSVGTPIRFERLAGYDCDEDLLEYLRLRTYLLGSGREVGEKEAKRLRRADERRKSCQEPVVAPQGVSAMEKELGRLPREQLLLDNHEYEVWYAGAKQIPRILHEIGRLREISFRGVQEGTGRSIDLDHFDNFYTHLFIWNNKKREVVGAYRLVKADYVLKRFGKRGLYTYTLFSFRSKLIRQLGPALELGRSFIRPEYQRVLLPLHLLWFGIGQYVQRNPRYKVLFGPVSINSEYDDVSRYLIMNFFNFNKYLPGFRNVFKARNPLRASIRGVGKEYARVVRDLKDVSELLSEIEAKHRSVPVLLRQYLKLNAKLLGFNVDPNFGDVLDGLIYVDFLETPPAVLERYIGKEPAQTVHEYHRKRSALKQTGTD